MIQSARGSLVSVVVPVYNAQDVVRETLESVLKQTWTEYEVIVVDDGSTDGSGDVVRAFGDRVRYIRQENGGVAKARNKGIAESKGIYVALLDHDDLWDRTKLEKQVALLNSHPEIGMVTTDVAHIDRSGKLMGLVGPAYQPYHDFARLFVQGFVPTPSAVMIRRSVLQEVGGFDERFHSAGMDDHELWTRIAAKTTIAGISEPLTYHRNREVKPADIALRHRPLLIDTLLARFGSDPNKRRYLVSEKANYLADWGKFLIGEGRRQEGRSYLRKGLTVSLREARNLKTAWRCFSRLARSYV